ncbi:MAG: PfkB family carbohydrate kinase [Actinomycetota bacterium]
MDVLGRPVESIPPGQGSVRLEEIRATAAGTAAGPAVDLAELGAQVSAVGAIGDDLIADIMAAVLSSYGIDTSGLVRKAGRQTAATMLPIRPNGERPALHVPGAMPYLTATDIDPAVLHGCDVLLIGAPDALGDIAASGLAELAAAARDGGAIVVIDVLRGGSTADFGRLGPLIGCADWFCPNDEQLRRLTGRADLAEAVGDVLALGTGGVAVTIGADGCLVTAGAPDDAGGLLLHLPAPPVDVVDTTGCGDGFDAGLIAGLLLGCDPADAARLGTACGSLVATGLGSDAGITSLPDTIDFLRGADPGAAERIAGLLMTAREGKVA